MRGEGIEGSEVGFEGSIVECFGGSRWGVHASRQWEWLLWSIQSRRSVDDFRVSLTIVGAVQKGQIIQIIVSFHRLQQAANLKRSLTSLSKETFSAFQPPSASLQ